MITKPHDMVFPISTPVDPLPNRHPSIQLGLTKREYFAAMAMQGLLSAARGWNAMDFSQCSVSYADALLAELSKVQP